MSNANVGNIYQQIINEVIEASRVDFEEGGVEESVLDDLRKVCFLWFLNAIFLIFLAACCNVVSCVRRGWRRQQVTRGMTVGRAVGEGDRRVARWVFGPF